MGLIDMIKRGYFPPWIVCIRLVTGFFFLIKFGFCNIAKIKNLRSAEKHTKRYVRPPRRFEIPQYQPGMKYYKLNEKYLRPTLYCNSHNAEIIALSSHLGAYRKSDWQYVESAFEFIKRNITIEIVPLDGVEDTLHRGTGTCLHRLALLVALCRTAGIKARYKLYSLSSMDTLDETLGSNQMESRWSEELGTLLYHGEAEIFIDGRWVVGSIGLTMERQASMNLPITKLGEVSLGVWYSADPQSVVQIESIPLGINVLMKLVYKLMPSAIDNVNANLLEQCQRGRAILKEKGEQAYDDEVRANYKSLIPEAIMNVRKEITFKK